MCAALQGAASNSVGDFVGATAAVHPQLLLQRLAQARAQTEALFAVVRPEAYYDRPIPERHRIIFYMGHLEAFDWNLLGQRLLGLESFSPEFDQLFSFGIDPVDGGLPTDTPQDWPRHDEVMRYNQTTRGLLDKSLGKQLDAASDSDDFPGRHREIAKLLHVAIEHRLMHAETLTYMLHQLPIDRKFRRSGLAAPAAPPAIAGMIEIPAGIATLGLERTKDGNGEEPFGWDNEFERHQVHVPAFRIDAHNVTNRDFLRFLNEGGYEDRDLWSSADWEWLKASGISHPGFWIPRDKVPYKNARGNEWHYRAMFEELPLPLDWPAYVSHAEATAYARWAGKELPSEEEWHRAAFGTPSADGSSARKERDYPWGDEAPGLSEDNASRGNFDFHRWDPTPAGAFPAGASAFGVYDLLGNGWEWTRTQFAPFEGFEPFPFYLGYSANFFDGKHYVMKGGSARTAACMLRRSFRNWFQPHYPFVYASFRCVER
ncbi:MAG TPA: SUMF1/EgtB/PvdO family nonheme iron enzyme [Candidatus Acidoferrales bacterium]